MHTWGGALILLNPLLEHHRLLVPRIKRSDVIDAVCRLTHMVSNARTDRMTWCAGSAGTWATGGMIVRGKRRPLVLFILAISRWYLASRARRCMLFPVAVMVHRCLRMLTLTRRRLRLTPRGACAARLMLSMENSLEKMMLRGWSPRGPTPLPLWCISLYRPMRVRMRLRWCRMNGCLELLSPRWHRLQCPPPRYWVKMHRPRRGL